jgi:5-methylcytosine-specific restriction endonuclease McrA
MSVSVYVLNMRGQPLMPTTPRKARKIIKNEKAKVIQRTPFVVQLKYATGETKRPITVGIDSGYDFIGFSAVTEKKELISGELKLRKDISKKLNQRRQYRNTRRGRLRYREPRFNNRTSTKKKGWLAPSINQKLESHKKLIEKIKSILPINQIIIEVATFDAHKMKKPEISGIEYQQGELLGYEIREYLLEKWKRKCAYCEKTGIKLEIEHIIPKSRGGSNRVDNLTLSCRKCNLKKGNQTAKEFGKPKIHAQAKQFLKTTPFMNVVRKRLVEELQCESTFGHITKHDRIKLGLDKSHANDAFVIAGGTDQKRTKAFQVKQIRRNNRSIQTNRKGYKPSIRRQRYKLQPNDLVSIENKLYFVKGVFNYGKSIRLRPVNDEKGVINKGIKKVRLVKYGKGLSFRYSV